MAEHDLAMEMSPRGVWNMEVAEEEAFQRQIELDRSVVR
jgi:hypothetical protein